MLADEQTLKFSRFRHENAAVVFVTRQAVSCFGDVTHFFSGNISGELKHV